MANMFLIAKTVFWTLVTLAIGFLALSLWPGSPSAELKPVSIQAFEPIAKTGRIHCFAPQHYRLGEIKRSNPQAEEKLREFVPHDIIDALNSDDIYSIVSVIDGNGIYLRYFGYRALADVAICW